MRKFDFYVRTKQDLIEAVQAFGIIPYFSTSIPGFSLEEHCPPYVLFSDDEENTWYWKGPVIQETHCAYGKFFDKKAAYVRSDLFLDLANYRRDGYDFDARYDDGMAKYDDKKLFEMIDRMSPVLSKELREAGGYAYNGRWKKVEGKKGFDTSLTRLQELCYVTTTDFVFKIGKDGNRHGIGVAQYSTPEKWFGTDFKDHVYDRNPDESYSRLMDHLVSLFPDVPEASLKKYLK